MAGAEGGSGLCKFACFNCNFILALPACFFHSTANCCICLFVRENSIKFLIGLHMWMEAIAGAGSSLRTLSIHLFPGGDIA